MNSDFDISLINYEKNNINYDKIKYLHQSQTNNPNTKKQLKYNYININSKNRTKKYTYQDYISETLITDAILFNGTNTIKIYHPNNNLDTTKKYNITISGVVGDTVNGSVKDTVCNYPLNLLNFDNENPTNIFTITQFTDIESTDGFYTVDNNYVYFKSDYYEVELKNILTESNSIKSGYVGGSNIKVQILKNINEIYTNINHYKIDLPRTYRNIVSVRLVSTEIPNLSNTINIATSEGTQNNKLLWINEEDKLTILDKEIVTDHVFLNSIDPVNYVNSEHLNGTPGRGSDTDGKYTIADLSIIKINDNPTPNQIAHATTIASNISGNADQQNSYCLLTNTIDTNQTISVPTNVNTFQTPSTIRNIYKSNRFYTPKKMFNSSYFLENNYHSFGKTLVAHIETLISLNSDALIKKLLPWEYNYYKIYSSRNREKYIGTNITWDKTSDNSNPLKYMGYQIFDSLLENKIGYSKVKFTSVETLTTKINSVKNVIIPKNIILGTEIVPQDPRDVSGVNTILEQNIYPVNSIYFDEGIYTTIQLIDILNAKLNENKSLYFDWKIKNWRDISSNSNKYILRQNILKHVFSIEYNLPNDSISIRQYNQIYYHNSLNKQIINEKDEEGKAGLYFIVNEGYPYICVMNKGHLLKNGKMLKIENSDNINNISENTINKLHNVIVNPVYKLHLRLIFPLPSKTYFRVLNANISSAVATNLENHQINSENIATLHDANVLDSIHKILVEVYGADTMNLLNKGTVDNMLNYVGSKLTQNIQDQNVSYDPQITTKYSKFENHITESTEDITHTPENPFQLHEIIVKYSSFTGESDNMTIGRVVSFEEDTDEYGNIQMNFELLTNKINNFSIGDIIVGKNSNVIAMIVPYNWEHARFPTKSEIQGGYREYLISQNNFNTNIPQFYRSPSNGIKNKKIKYQFNRKWYLEPVNNGEESFSIDVNTVPTFTDLEGIYNETLELLTPTKFSILFGLNDTIGKQIGFNSNKEGIIDHIVSSSEIKPNFKYSISNTVKQDELTIKSTKFVKLYDNKSSNYLLIECYDNIPYSQGDKVYFENHILNKYQETQPKVEELLIKQIYPLKDWLYSLESRYINNSLNNNIDATTAETAIQVKINNLKTWFYQNIKTWTAHNIDYENYIIKNYFYPRILHGPSEVTIHVSKIYVQETTGDRLSSTAFLPGMTITHAATIIGLKVLGITKVKHTTDTHYNEEPVTHINDISDNDYYYIYFQRLSTVALSGLDATETVSYTDGSGSTNLRNASATLVNITGTSDPYVEDASIDYLYYFYLANKTILEYKTYISKEEEQYIESTNVNIDDTTLSINPLAGNSNNNYSYISNLSYDPNNSNIEYGQTGANNGPFYITSGSSTIKVIHPYHGLNVNDEIIITGSSDVIANEVIASDLNVTTKVTKVIDSSSYNIAPTLTDSSPSSTVYGGGALVKIEYKPKNIDVNINAIPIATLQPGDNVYITNHQKTVPKYYEENDVLETDELYMNKLKNITNDANTNATVTNKNSSHVTGIKDGVYKSLINLWPGEKSDNYYMSKYIPGKTILTDIEWTNEVSKGFANQGGKMRVKRKGYSVVGNNEYEHIVSNGLQNSNVDDDLSEERFTVLSSAITTVNTATVTSIYVLKATELEIGGLILIDPIIYSQNIVSDANHNEQNTITEINIVNKISTPVDSVSDDSGKLKFTKSGLHNLNMNDAITLSVVDGVLPEGLDGSTTYYIYTDTLTQFTVFYLSETELDIENASTDNTISVINSDLGSGTIYYNRIGGVGPYKIDLQFQLLNNHAIYSYVIQKGFCTTLKNAASATDTAIVIDLSNDYFAVDDIINLGFNSFNSNLSEGDVDYFTEQRNIVTAKSTVGSDVTLTLQNALLLGYSAGTYVYKMAPEKKNKNDLKHNFLSTQNVLIRGEWYTKIFYQGAPLVQDISVTDGEFSEGANAFNKYTQKEVYISGMKGMSVPDISFDNYSSYITNKSTLNSTYTQSSYNITQITPVLDGFYKLYPNIEQDNVQYLMTNNLNIKIQGDFYKINHTPYEPISYWRDKGYSRTETVASDKTTLTIGTQATFGTEIISGETNENIILTPGITGITGRRLNYGWSIDVYDDLLAVGSDYLSFGAVYVYRKNKATGNYETLTAVQIESLKAQGASFGHSVSIYGNYLAIGAPNYPSGNNNIGLAYLYKRNGDSYEQLKAWDGTTIDSDNGISYTYSNKAQFGYKVLLYKEYLLISAIEKETGYSGRVYMFKQNEGGADNWGLFRIVLQYDVGTVANPPSGGTDNDEGESFGYSMVMDDHFLHISAPFRTTSRNFTAEGVVWSYKKNYGGSDNWGPSVGYRNPYDYRNDLNFGNAMAYSNEYLAIGAWQARISGELRSGHVVIVKFDVESASVGTNIQEIEPPTPTKNQRFGTSLAFADNANYLIVGCSPYYNSSVDKSVRISLKDVFVYRRTGDVFSLISTIRNSNDHWQDYFGKCLAHNGESIIIGSPGPSRESETKYAIQSLEDSGGKLIFVRSLHQFYDNDRIWLDITGDATLPTGFSEETDYYVFNIVGESTKFALSASENPSSLSDCIDASGSSPSYGGSSITNIDLIHKYLGNGKVYIFNQTNTDDDKNGLVNVIDHTTHELYLDGVKQQLTIDYTITNDTTITTANTISAGTVVEHSINGWRKIYETSREFNCVLIKGKYLGYGGQIELKDKENILENPDGFEVKQIVYINNNPLTPSNKFFINLQKNQTDFRETYENEQIVPSSSLYKNLTLLESNSLLTDNNNIGAGGSVYKLVRDTPINKDSDYFNMCVTGLDTIHNTSTNNIDDIFAKILLPQGSGNTYYDTFVSTPKLFEKFPLHELSQLEIKFVDNDNNPINFNNNNYSFTLEITELNEDLHNINPRI